MEPEINMPEPRYKEIIKPLCQVTPLSKYFAMILFIALPFVGGYVGYHFAPVKVVEVERVVDENQKKQSEMGVNVNAESDSTDISSQIKSISINYGDSSGLYQGIERYIERESFQVEPNFALVFRPETEKFFTLPISLVDADDRMLITSLFPVEAGYPVQLGDSWYFFARYEDGIQAHSMIFKYDTAKEPNRTDEMYATNFQVSPVFKSDNWQHHFYPVSGKVNSDRYLFIKAGSWGCWIACGGEFHKYHIFDTETLEMMELGEINGATFEWIGEGEYRYKTYEQLPDSESSKVIECSETDSVFACYGLIDWEQVDWVYGSVNN